MSNLADSNFPYLPHTKDDRLLMLQKIGVQSFEDLISHIPASVRCKDLKLPLSLSELELKTILTNLALKNKTASSQICFLGGGSYRRYIPAVVQNVVMRSEFLTSYTPYQPEVSQGSLQAIYEFQTAICNLTNMDVANASMYDGPTACAEAAMMAIRITNKNKIVFSESVNPDYKEVIKTYVKACNLNYIELPNSIPTINPISLDALKDSACLIIQNPNYFGCLEDLQEVAKICSNTGCLMIVVVDPISLSILKPPGSFGADIVIGDAQPCGNGLSFGGPSAGFMACKQAYVRQLPGRLVGITKDIHGNRAFTLTLQTREQHIRRAKANSNICTNQSLNALTMLVYLSCLGPIGLKEIEQISLERAHYLANKLSNVTGVKILFKQPFLNEFVIETSKPAKLVLQSLTEFNILGGIDMSESFPQFPNAILIAVTELNNKSDLDIYVTQITKVLNNFSNANQHVTSSKASLTSKE